MKPVQVHPLKCGVHPLKCGVDDVLLLHPKALGSKWAIINLFEQVTDCVP